MKKKKDTVRAGEFRRNNARSGHPAYITEVKKNKKKKPKAKFIGLTESKETHGKKNIPLNKNPNPKNQSKKAYVRPEVDEVDLDNSTFGKKLKWEFAPEDLVKVEIIIEKDKKNAESNRSARN